MFSNCARLDISFHFAPYISSSGNIEANNVARSSSNNTERDLADFAFNKIIASFGTPDIDFFASGINVKCQNFVSYHKDSDAVAHP